MAPIPLNFTLNAYKVISVITNYKLEIQFLIKIDTMKNILFYNMKLKICVVVEKKGKYLKKKL